jgi:hypothetical protein
MNKIQKKALLASIILGLEYLIIEMSAGVSGYLFGGFALSIIIIWLYLFEISLTKEKLLRSIRLLLIPLMFNLGSILYISYFFQGGVRLFAVAVISIINYYLFVALRRVQNLAEKAAIFQRNVIISVSFLSVFLSLSAIFRFYVSFSISDFFRVPQVLVVISTGLIFYAVSNFLAWENGLDMKKFLPYNLVTSLLGAQIAWVASIWIVNYPVFTESEKANLGGSPLPAIFLTIIFYFLWGIISHKADKSLNKNVLAEYFFISLMFILILVLTAKWLPHI